MRAAAGDGEPVGARRRRARQPVRRRRAARRADRDLRARRPRHRDRRCSRGRSRGQLTLTSTEELDPRLRPERLRAQACPRGDRGRRSGPPPRRTSPCPGSRIGFLKRTSAVNASGSRSDGQAARLRPHPVRDRAREAERPSRVQRVQVDRVVVAGDGGVAAAEVVRAAATAAVTGGSSNVGRRGQRVVAVAALEVRRRRSSHTSSSPTRTSVTKSNSRPRRCGRSSLTETLSASVLAEQQRAVLDDPVGDVHDADGAERRLAPAAPCASRTRARAGRSAGARRAA